MRFGTFVLLTGVAVIFLASAVVAQPVLPQRTFVAQIGSDAAPCSLVAPCRSLTAAVNAVADGGEVVVLSSAGYGVVAIGKSVSITAPAGVYAGVTATSGDAISINAPGGTVALRGLAINGAGADNGVHAISVGSLHIESSSIAEFNSNGVFLENSGFVSIDDVIARENYRGVWVFPASGLILGSIDHCRFKSSSNGVVVQGTSGGTFVTVSDSVFANDSGVGIYVDNAAVSVKNCVLTNSGHALEINGSATINVSGSMVARSQVAFSNISGNFYSFGNNQLVGNVAQTSGTITLVGEQ